MPSLKLPFGVIIFSVVWPPECSFASRMANLGQRVSYRSGSRCDMRHILTYFIKILLKDTLMTVCGARTPKRVFAVLRTRTGQSAFSNRPSYRTSSRGSASSACRDADCSYWPLRPSRSQWYLPALPLRPCNRG